jgi:thiol:disulfide interchange protein DsbC
MDLKPNRCAPENALASIDLRHARFAFSGQSKRAMVYFRFFELSGRICFYRFETTTLELSMLRQTILSALVASSLALASAAYADDAKVRAAVSALIPTATIDSIKASPVSGFSEVVVQGHVVYVSNDGKHLMQGPLYDVQKKEDLTESTMRVIRASAMEKQKEADRIVFKAKGGIPKYKVAVFTDIDCGYCRRMHTQMAEYNALGIEIDYLFFPRAGVPSDSSRKAIAVWCAKDQQGAMTVAKDGKDPGNATCANPVESQFKLAQQVGVTGTPSMVLDDGTVVPGYLPPQDLLARLDQIHAAKK